MDKVYLCIDLKSFYASVECVVRGLDPMKTNLVVADEQRTEKTICLAVSPSLKAYGISGRARLFEVVSKIKEVNAKRKKLLGDMDFLEKSFDDTKIKSSCRVEVDYIVAPPRMALYMEYSTRIYEIYLKYVSADDIHVYSIDEVFIDLTPYLKNASKTAREFSMDIIRDVLKETGITATVGLGTNMYLAKIAMDIVAKKAPADKDGVRIAELDEISYRKQLWSHKPITDFWRVGKGYKKRLESIGLYTMGDVAKCSLGKPNEYYNEDILYKLFGVNAELLIDHAWGYEPCTIEHIKKYKPRSSSLGSGQVLHCAYTFEKAKLILKEMTELLVLDLVDKNLVANQMILTVGYDIENLIDEKIKSEYRGEISTDAYGRKVPKSAHSSINLNRFTSSTRLILNAVMDLYEKIVDKRLLIRRINIVANNVVPENSVVEKKVYTQLDLLGDTDKIFEEKRSEEEFLKKEKSIQKTMINIKKKYGKNAVLKGMNFEEGATAIQRNNQIGGHKA